MMMARRPQTLAAALALTLALGVAAAGETAPKRAVLITGASSGIGRATAAELAQRGWAVLASARSTAKLESLVAEITAAGGEAYAVPCDVSKPEQIPELFAAVEAAVGDRLDAVFLNAGVEADMTTMAEADLGRTLATIQVNAVGTTLTHHATVAYWKRLGKTGGTIVMSGSIASLVKRSVAAVAMPSGWAVYCATKAYVDALVRTSAGLLPEMGVKAYSLAIAAFDTGMLERFADGFGMPDVSAASGFNPVFKQRLGDPRAIANVVQALIEDRSEWAPFSTIVVDNGATLDSQLYYDDLESNAVSGMDPLPLSALRSPSGGEYTGPLPAPPAEAPAHDDL